MLSPLDKKALVTGKSQSSQTYARCALFRSNSNQFGASIGLSSFLIVEKDGFMDDILTDSPDLEGINIGKL